MNRGWSRRRWLQAVLAGSAGLALPALAEDTSATPEGPEERWLELFGLHSRETLRVVYRRGQEFDAAALEQLRQHLRDRRNGRTHPIDPALFDQLYDLAQAAGVEPRYEIISAYRSPESNDRMSAREGSGVAKKSLHMQGRALDVRLKNCSCEKLRDLAIAAKRGGVGYYQRSDFVHLDTGSFRTWSG